MIIANSYYRKSVSSLMNYVENIVPLYAETALQQCGCPYTRLTDHCPFTPQRLLRPLLFFHVTVPPTDKIIVSRQRDLKVGALIVLHAATLVGRTQEWSLPDKFNKSEKYLAHHVVRKGAWQASVQVLPITVYMRTAPVPPIKTSLKCIQNIIFVNEAVTSPVSLITQMFC